MSAAELSNLQHFAHVGDELGAVVLGHGAEVRAVGLVDPQQREVERRAELGSEYSWTRAAEQQRAGGSWRLTFSFRVLNQEFLGDGLSACLKSFIVSFNIETLEIHVHYRFC